LLSTKHTLLRPTQGIADYAAFLVDPDGYRFDVAIKLTAEASTALKT
jgi:hypothetical protein